MTSSTYELGAHLGGGSFGQVWKATHIDLGDERALKIIEIESGQTEKELLAEARKMLKVDGHENVVGVKDAGVWGDDEVFIASELCQDGSLEDLSRESIFPAEVCRLISDSCRGLIHIHRQGLLHLDLRPANILLSGATPKICDFGLSKFKTNAHLPKFYWPHAAPEIIEGLGGSEEADQFSMAKTLAHMLSSREACHQAVDKPVPVHQFSFHIPSRLVKVLRKATHEQPDRRYDSVERFKQALDKATPRVSFKRIGPETFESDKEGWSIHLIRKSGSYGFDVKKNRRRQTSLCCSGLTENDMLKEAGKTIDLFAQP